MPVHRLKPAWQRYGTIQRLQQVLERLRHFRDAGIRPFGACLRSPGIQVAR